MQLSAGLGGMEVALNNGIGIGWRGQHIYACPIPP